MHFYNIRFNHGFEYETAVIYMSVVSNMQKYAIKNMPLTQSRLITLLPSLIARRWVGRQIQ